MNDNLLEVVWHELGHCVMCVITEKNVKQICFKINRGYTGIEKYESWSGDVKFTPFYNPGIDNVEGLVNHILTLLTGTAFQVYFKNNIEDYNRNIFSVLRNQSTGKNDSDYEKIIKCLISYNVANDLKINTDEVIIFFIKEIYESIKSSIGTRFKYICEEVESKVRLKAEKGIISASIDEDLECIINSINMSIDSNFRTSILNLKKELLLKLNSPS